MILKKLKSLLEIDSKSSNIEGVNELGLKIKEMLSGLPLKWQEIKRENAATFLIAETINNDPTKPMTTLSMHMDVVYEADAFKIKETEDKLFGSGVSDMKASIIIVIEVLKKLYAENKLQNIILSLSPEEETATLNYRDVIADIAQRSDYVLVFEAFHDKDPKDRSIVVSRRGFHQFDLTIEGPGGHSGLIVEKEKRKNTNLLAAEIILELEKLADYEKLTTLNIGFVNGGQAINVLSPKTTISFETRFKTEDEHQRVVKGINSLVEKYSQDGEFKLLLEQKLDYPCLLRNNNNEGFIKICQEVGQKAGLNIILEERNAGSEACLFNHYNPNAGVLDAFGARGFEEHTKNEYIHKDSLDSTIEYVHEIIKQLVLSFNTSEFELLRYAQQEK